MVAGRKCSPAFMGGAALLLVAVFCLASRATAEEAAFRCTLLRSTDRRAIDIMGRSSDKSTIRKIYDCPAATEVIERSLDEPTISVHKTNPTYRKVFEDIAVMEYKKRNVHLNFYIVGGAVRDALKGIEPKDIDASVDIKLKDLAHDLNEDGRYRPDPTKNTAFLVLLGKEDQGIDLTQTTNNVYARNEWRDVSVNSLYYDLKNKVILDGTGYGVDDVNSDTLRLSTETDDWCNAPRIQCNAKVQRYLHMRVKGYKPRPQSLRLVIPHLRDMIARRDGGLAFKLAKSTFSRNLSPEKRVQRLEALEDTTVADLMVIPPPNPSKHLTPREVATQTFWTGLAPLLFDVDSDDPTHWLLKPKYGAWIPGLMAKYNGKWLELPYADDELPVVADGYVTECKLRRAALVDDADRPDELPPCGQQMFLDMNKVRQLNDRTLAAANSVAVKGWRNELANKFNDFNSHMDRNVARILSSHPGVRWAAREVARRAVIVHQEYSKVVTMDYAKLLDQLKTQSWIPGTNPKIVKQAGHMDFIRRQFPSKGNELDPNVIQAILDPDRPRAVSTHEQSIAEQLALAYHLLAGLPSMQLPPSLFHHDLGKDWAATADATLQRVNDELEACMVLTPEENLCSGFAKTAYGTPVRGWAFLAKYCDDKVCPVSRTFPASGGAPRVSTNGVGVNNFVGFRLQAESNRYSTKAGPAVEGSSLYRYAQEGLGFTEPQQKLVGLAVLAWLSGSRNAPSSVYEVLVATMGDDLVRMDDMEWLNAIPSIVEEDTKIEFNESKRRLNSESDVISAETYSPEEIIAHMDAHDGMSVFEHFFRGNFGEKLKEYIIGEGFSLLSSEIIAVDRNGPAVLGLMALKGNIEQLRVAIRGYHAYHDEKERTAKEKYVAILESMTLLLNKLEKLSADAAEVMELAIRRVSEWVMRPVDDSIFSAGKEFQDRMNIGVFSKMMEAQSALQKAMVEYHNIAMSHKRMVQFSGRRVQKHFLVEHPLFEVVHLDGLKTQSIADIISGAERVAIALTQAFENVHKRKVDVFDQMLMNALSFTKSCYFPWENPTSPAEPGTRTCQTAIRIRRAMVSLYFQRNLQKMWMPEMRMYKFGYGTKVAFVESNGTRGLGVVVGGSIRRRLVRHYFSNNIFVAGEAELTLAPELNVRGGFASRERQTIRMLKDTSAIPIAGGMFTSEVMSVKPCGYPEMSEGKSMMYRVPIVRPSATDKDQGHIQTETVWESSVISLERPNMVKKELKGEIAEWLKTWPLGSQVDCLFITGDSEHWMPGKLKELDTYKDPFAYLCAPDYTDLRRYAGMPYLTTNIDPVYVSDSASNMHTRDKGFFAKDVRLALIAQSDVREGTTVQVKSTGKYGDIVAIALDWVAGDKSDKLFPQLTFNVRRADGGTVTVTRNMINVGEIVTPPRATHLLSFLNTKQEEGALIQVNVLDRSCFSGFARKDMIGEDWYPVNLLGMEHGVWHFKVPTATMPLQGLGLVQGEIVPENGAALSIDWRQDASPECIKVIPPTTLESFMNMKMLKQISRRYPRGSVVDIFHEKDNKWVPSTVTDPPEVSNGGIVLPIQYEEDTIMGGLRNWLGMGKLKETVNIKWLFRNAHIRWPLV